MGFVPEFFEGLLLALFVPLSELEKAASSIILSFVDNLLDPEEDLEDLEDLEGLEDLVGLSLSNLEDGC